MISVASVDPLFAIVIAFNVVGTEVEGIVEARVGVVVGSSINAPVSNKCDENCSRWHSRSSKRAIDDVVRFQADGRDNHENIAKMSHKYNREGLTH
jgi:hypothetical protein